MRNTLVAFLCLFSTLSFNVSAKTKIDIFHAEVPLSTDKNARNIAWGEGLKQVLIRATGDQNIADNDVVKKAMNRGSNYLSQFQYGTLNEQPSMVMDFNSAQIEDLLIRADVNYWPAERNNILVWLVEDNGNQKDIGWEQSGLQSLTDLQLASNLSGLPITLPLGDMQDLTSISATDIWGSFMAPISEVSQRYPVDGVLILKVTHNGDDRAEVNWQLFDMAPQQIANNAQSPLTGSESGTSLDSISNAIIQVSHYYASQNQTSVKKQSEGGLQAHFSGITNARQYFALVKLLTSFNSVASVNVKTIQGTNVSFMVELFGSADDFAKEAAGNKNLTQTEAPIIETVPEVIEVANSEVNAEELGLNAEVDSKVQSVISQDATDNSAMNSKPEIEQLWFDFK